MMRVHAIGKARHSSLDGGPSEARFDIWKPNMTDETSPFPRLLEPEEISPGRFRFTGPATKWKRIYGGLVISQALAAVYKTVPDDRQAHSMHAYFILAGDPSEPVVYEIDRLRDGRSFSTRHCRASQHSQVIFVLTASFHRDEEGLEHMRPAPAAPPPEQLENFAQLQDRYRPQASRHFFEYFAANRPIEFRPVDPSRYFPAARPAKAHAGQMIWFRTTHPLPDDRALHQCVLAYASDMTILDSTLAVHGRSVTDGNMQPASLDHSIWFHRSFRADEWLLYVQESPTAGRGRGFARGFIYTEGGSLIASVAQEGMIRLRKSSSRPDST